MKCGNCKDDHDTADAVRYCYGTRRMRPVKPSEERRDEVRRDTFDEIRTVSARIAEGRYAIRNPYGINDISFYRVTKPTEGRWAGRTFINQLVSDEEQRLSLPRQLDAFTRIAADPKGAMLLYGQEIGRCGHCGRTLTNAESRAYGIGPVCRQGMGWNAA